MRWWICREFLRTVDKDSILCAYYLQLKGHSINQASTLNCEWQNIMANDERLPFGIKKYAHPLINYTWSWWPTITTMGKNNKRYSKSTGNKHSFRKGFPIFHYLLGGVSRYRCGINLWPTRNDHAGCYFKSRKTPKGRFIQLVTIFRDRPDISLAPQ